MLEMIVAKYVGCYAAREIKNSVCGEEERRRLGDALFVHHNPHCLQCGPTPDNLSLIASDYRKFCNDKRRCISTKGRNLAISVN